MKGPTLQSRRIVPAEHLENLRYAIRDIEVMADTLADEGKKIIRLNIGDPLKSDFCTPPHVIDAVVKAMRDGKNGYAPSGGVPEALEAIRREADGKSIRNVQDAFVTEGVSEGIEVCLSALLNPGENVLLPRPEYPCYSAVMRKINARSILYDLEEDLGWEPNLDQIEQQINSRTRAIVLINPNNPTGSVCSLGTLERIVELAREHGLVILSDEIYDKLSLESEEKTPSIAALAPEVPTVTLNGLSKSYLVPGWRLGWVVVSGEAEILKPYIDTMHKLLRTRLSANHAEQYAIPAALEGSQLHLVEMRRKLRSRRDLVVKQWTGVPGLSLEPPRAAFYAFPRIRIAGSDKTFARKLLRETGVLVVPGSGFGEKDDTSHFRLVYLADEAQLGEAMEKIREFIEARYEGDVIRID